ncbi:unnamed protein product [Adineta steineri]|uniref:Uncharacterized protein n=1 Tax=Adineta steineri TaxID=433720 RepID=A0A814KIH4_9BILA|nr:unnamed protein product [Adineta steineri]CAF1082212.1 unnamed protein product [Adineta steineri]
MVVQTLVLTLVALLSTLADDQEPIPFLYYGLEWSNGGYLMSSKYPGNGYFTALSSGQYVGYNGNGNPMSIGAGALSSLHTFNIKSFVAAAAWNNHLELLIIGERSGVSVHSKTITLQTKLATTIILDWNSIDKIIFRTYGGIDANLGGNGLHFAMDNLCITAGTQERIELLYKCDYWGDPQLIQFPKATGSTVTSTWCQITGASVLYRSSYVLINVVNSGSSNGDIVTSFDMTLYDSNNIPLCTLTPSDVTGTPRSCGPDVTISKTGSDLNVAYKKAPFSAWIKYSSWGGGHYTFTLFATLKHINEVGTTGMCVKGCTGKREAPQMIITDSTTDKEIVISAMADSVCDTFMKQATQQALRDDLVVETTPGYIEAVRRACIIDVTVTGSTQFAEQSVNNVITDILTHTGEIKIEEINNIIQNTTQIAVETINQVATEVETMIEGSTWPCQPDVPVCIMPFLLRQKFAKIGK